MRFEGDVAIVTGSTKGIGRAMADKFAAEGAKVVVTGRSEDLGTEVADNIVRNGGEAIFVRADVTEEDEVRGLIEAAVDRFGKLNTLVNNAAPIDLLVGSSALDDTVVNLSTDAWNKLMTGGITSAFWACKYAIPELAKVGGGAIINISSVSSVLATVGTTGYSAAKAAMHALTRSVAVDSAMHNIRCNCILVGTILIPGRDDAAMGGAWGEALRNNQLLRMGTPEDIANLTAFLASREAEYLTGIVIPADGGAMAKMPLPPLSILHEQYAAAAAAAAE